MNQRTIVFYDKARGIWSEMTQDGTIDDVSFELEIHKRLLQIFQVGDSYYFIFNIKLGEFEHISSEINTILGYTSDISASFFLNQIHPEDQPYFLAFENELNYFFRQLPLGKIMKYKVRYDFRIKDSLGNYKRILHQLVIIQHDDNNNLLRSLGVHTDITHLKENGAPKLSFIGLDGEPSYPEVKTSQIYTAVKTFLTPREKQIVYYMIEGYNSKQISKELNISKHTVDTHRRNLLTKTHCKNVVELVSKAIQERWI